MSPRVSRTGYCTAALLGACLFVVLLLARPDMSTARKVFTYKIVHARLDVEEAAKYVTSGRGRWDASAHHHDVQQEEGDLPPLPSSLPRSGGSVFAISDASVDGDETLIDSQG